MRAGSKPKETTARATHGPSQMLPCEKVGNGPRDFNGKRELVDK